MSSRRVLIPALGALALAACSTARTHIGDEDPGMGEAVKYNAAIQTVNPAPVYPPAAAQPGDNGDKGAQAAKRYRTDKVKEVDTYQTSAGSASSGATSGSTPH